ncbi:MAG: hypothetical protein KFW21_02450 [Spirochaetota bacterium]|nr:hypothetical protein [Spirochaetota bacterium]
MEFIWNNFLSLLIIIGLITVIIFYIGDRLIFYANQLAVVTNISGAFIGFVLIAMITSIPEMVSTFISIKKGLINLAVGGVLGSNMLNIALLSTIFLIFKDKKLKIEKSSIFSFVSSLILLGIIGFVIVLYPVSNIIPNQYVVIFVFMIIYSFIMKQAYNLNEPEDKKESPLKDKEESPTKIIISFAFFSSIIIGLSWILVSICQQIALVDVPIYGQALGEHFIGSLILAIATSIPELATTFQIVRRGFTNMAIENIAGSNIFNLLILVLASLFSTQNLWIQIPFNSLYTIFLIFIVSLLICVIGLIKKESKILTYTIYTVIISLWLYSLVLVF